LLEFEKQLIEVHNLPSLRTQLQAQVKVASPTIQHIKCLFGYKDSTIIYAYTAFDFLDHYDEILNNGVLEKFYIYQLIEKKSIS